MSTYRILVYSFYKLPFHVQISILGKLNCLPEGWRDFKTNSEVLNSGLLLVSAAGRLEALSVEIEDAQGELL